MATTTNKLTATEVRTARCGLWHGGNHTLTATTSRENAECCGCGQSYTALEVKQARGLTGQRGAVRVVR